MRNITGCLSKGDSADEFLLTGKDGSTWEVRSKKVTLADHDGHTVTGHGVVSNSTMHNVKEDAKNAAVDSGVKENDAERSPDNFFPQNGLQFLQEVVTRTVNTEYVERTISMRSSVIRIGVPYPVHRGQHPEWRIEFSMERNTGECLPSSHILISVI